MDIRKQDIDYLDCWYASIFVIMFLLCLRCCVVVLVLHHTFF